MDGDIKNTPSQINSLHHDMALDSNFVDLSKKRKLQAEQLGLPISKPKCWDRCFFPKPLSISEEIEEAEDISADKEEVYEGSDPESAKDSNSFVEDSTSAMSDSGESKLETEIKKAWPSDRPSTSTFNLDSSSFKENQFPQNLEDFENHLERDYLEYGNDNNMKAYAEKELNDFLYSNGASPNMYVLSSGRWNVNQDAQSSSTRKPTIDQEFEQYFSMLML